MTWQIVLAIIGVVICSLLLGEGFFRFRVSYFFSNLSDEGRSAEEEWRTHVVNDYIGLLAVASGEDVDEMAATVDKHNKDTTYNLHITPTVFDETVITFYYYDGILTTRFNWSRGTVDCNVTCVGENMYCKRKKFRFKNAALPYGCMKKWLEDVVDNMAGGFSEEDVLQLLAISKKFIGTEDTEEDKVNRFETMLDFAALMTEKKRTKDKPLRRVYGQVLKMLMRFQGQEFIDYVQSQNKQDGVNQKD